MKIQALLFDLDDTLVVEEKSAHDSFLAVSSYVKNHYAYIDENDFIKTIRKTAKELWYSLPTIDYCKRIGISSWEGLWAEFTEMDQDQKKLKELKEYYQFNAWNNALKETGIINESLANEIAGLFKFERNRRHVLFPDTLPFLNRIKGNYRLALITNGSPDLQRIKTDRSGLRDYFDFIAVSGEIGFAKPHKNIFEIALRELHVSHKDALMIGDNPHTDIKGANERGIVSVWINRNDKIPDDENKPCYEIKSFNGMYSIIDEPLS